MRYLAAGSGPPLILVHGIAAYSFSWRWNIESLARHFTVYAPDFLCLGYSDCPSELDAGLPATAERLLAFLDAMHLNKPYFVASSHGATVLMQMAANHPDRVASMVLVSPVHPYSRKFRGTVMEWLSPLGLSLAALIRYCPDPMFRYAIGRMYGDRGRVLSDVGQGYGACLRRSDTVAFVVKAMRTLIAETDALAALLPKLREIPTLLLWGDRDPVIELESAYELQKHLPGSELVLIPTAGHLPYEETPEAFSQAVLPFLMAHVEAPKSSVAPRGDGA
jgi:pimeloyl-ACP methyl ester carboxylesterase